MEDASDASLVRLYSSAPSASILSSLKRVYKNSDVLNPLKETHRQTDQYKSSSDNPKKQHYADLADFVRTHKIKLVVSRMISGVDDVEKVNVFVGELAKGSQFGRSVVRWSRSRYRAKCDGEAEKTGSVRKTYKISVARLTYP